MPVSSSPHIVIVGGGPAGLHAAEIASAQGARVTLFEAKPSVGRKLLVAGRGGLNLTHGEPADLFVSRYQGRDMPEQWWARCLAEFSPSDLRQWAEGLGVETFQQRTGRVYPREMKAAPLLRRWVERLRAQGVKLLMKHRLTDLKSGVPTQLTFESPSGPVTVEADAVILAMGGASWSITGSDGRWAEWLGSRGVAIHPWQAANCGWDVAWPESLMPQIEGQPLKNCAVRVGSQWLRGELMLTRYGVEGGLIYQFGPALRAMQSPEFIIDLKPDTDEATLLRKMETVRQNFLEAAQKNWRLSAAAHALLAWHAEQLGICEISDLVTLVKSLRVPLLRPRPIDEAISSAGGVAWWALSDDLSLRNMPHVFVAGEMIDWEAPTGGYLMQGCFASGRWAARGALAFCSKDPRIQH